MYAVGMHASGCVPSLYDHTPNPCALRRLQPAANTHLTISHEDNPLYDGETTPPTLMNDSTDICLACAADARKSLPTMETRGRALRVHAEWRGGAMEPQLRGGDGWGVPSLPISWSAMTIAPCVYRL
ncbi:hypothetical protein IW261DRAFT_1612424 [Armillaria novae-zelandiae]|uniref:Uncharacterized protein n=1 Tax=Armillaria novae-zelandiae TaxID=153914 RepID=A0AA39U9R2_9AGAR|nr:hypothetical protein IW261DRAFT_1612424 [Armillaria novae-zelandiae]